MQKNQILSAVPLFAALPVEEIEHLARTLQAQQATQYAWLLREGTRSEDCFIILEGEVEIIKAAGTPDERILGVRGPGSLLGEMALFSDEGTSTASVRALTPLATLVFTRTDLDSLLKRQPLLAYRLVRTMSHRLSETENLTIRDLREKNRQLTQAYQELQEAQARLVEQEKLAREMEIARQIQYSILPKGMPHLPGWEFGAHISPARAVGGDFYDFIPLSGGQLGIVVGDVSDKGMAAALYMSLVYSLLRAEAPRHRTPGGVLQAVNRLLLEIDVARMYVTLVYGVLDPSNCSFNYARSGHPYPILLQDSGEPLALAAGIGQPLGLLPNPTLDEHQVVLPAGGLALFYTDGATEASDLQSGLLDTDRLVEMLRQSRTLPAAEICRQLFRQVIEYTGSQSQQDDITLLCIRSL